MVVLSNLSQENLSLDTNDIVFNDKTLRAFNLFQWLATSSPETIKNAHTLIADDLAAGGKIFGTQIVKEVTLDQFKEAIEESGKIATEGKILINTQ